MSRLLILFHIAIVMILPGLTPLLAQSDTTDPCYNSPLQRQSASLETPSGIVLNAYIPVKGIFRGDKLNREQIKSEPVYRFDAIYYYDSYQFGVKATQTGYCLMLGTRSIKRDIASAFYVQAGITHQYKTRFPTIISDNKPVYIGLGMRISDFYFRTHDYVYFVDLSFDGFSFGEIYRLSTQLEIGSGWRYALGNSTITPGISLALGLMPPEGYYLTGDRYSTYEMDNILLFSINFHLSFALNSAAIL